VRLELVVSGYIDWLSAAGPPDLTPAGPGGARRALRIAVPVAGAGGQPVGSVPDELKPSMGTKGEQWHESAASLDGGYAIFMLPGLLAFLVVIVGPFLATIASASRSGTAFNRRRGSG